MVSATFYFHKCDNRCTFLAASGDDYTTATPSSHSALDPALTDTPKTIYRQLSPFAAAHRTVRTRNRNTQVNIDQSYKATEKYNIECAIAAVQTHRPTNQRRRLCGLGQSMVLLTHRYFINRCSPAPIAETAAALMLSLKTVQRIVRRSVVTTNIMSCLVVATKIQIILVTILVILLLLK